jgi:hypothetical protein
VELIVHSGSQAAAAPFDINEMELAKELLDHFWTS